jgi:hypothetical protein
MEKIHFGLKARHEISGLCLSSVENKWSYEENLNEWLKNNFHFPSNASFVCYNDQVPDGFDSFSNSCSFAHSKGVLVWTETHLVWLIHSVPKWPHIQLNFPEKKSWWNVFTNLYSCFRRSFCCCCCCSPYIKTTTLPDVPQGETKYGQSFVVLHMAISEKEIIDNILKQLLFMNVQMYHLQNVLQEKIDTLKKQSACLEKHKLSVLETTPTIKHCAKSHFHHVDFYESLVTLTGVEQCYVESWMRPAMEESSTVKHIKQMEWTDENEKHFQMKESSDHSKWAISKGGRKPWVFVGDLHP